MGLAEDIKPQRRRLLQNPLNPAIEYFARRFGGENAKELERFLKFAVVGGLGAVIDLGILTLSQATFLPPTNNLGEPLPTNVTIATALAFSTAVLSNFIWTTLWVYPDSRRHSKQKQLVQFSIISVVGGVARTIWVRQTFHGMGQAVMPLVLTFIHVYDPGYLLSKDASGCVDFVARALAEDKLGSIITQMIAMIVVMFWNFFVNRYITYSDVN